MSAELYGMAASFPSPEAFLQALRRLRDDGHVRIEANVPFAVKGMEELLPGKPTPVARVVLVAALCSGTTGCGLQYWAVHAYAFNVGGRPINSWPAFVPVIFELTVLCAALCGVAALLWLAGLPRLDHPLFAVPDFRRATQDRFFVCVRADDPRFDRRELAMLFHTLGAESVAEVLS